MVTWGDSLNSLDPSSDCLLPFLLSYTIASTENQSSLKKTENVEILILVPGVVLPKAYQLHVNS